MTTLTTASDLPALAEPGEVMSKAGAENFPVALAVLPQRYRTHLLAVYGYARLVDDAGDDPDAEPAQRLVALDAIEAELDRAIAGTATHPIFVQLSSTIAACNMSREPFGDLIEANRLDQRRSSYATFDDLLGYCRLSANPVGRLVLDVFSARSEENDRLSDLVCSALQVVEHLQDVAEDAALGRIYLPIENFELFGVDRSSLETARPAGPQTPPTPAAFRRLIAYESSRARTMLEEGSRLVDQVTGFARLAIAGFVGGGLAQLDAIEAARYDVLARETKATRWAVLGGSVHLAAHRLRGIADLAKGTLPGAPR